MKRVIKISLAVIGVLFIIIQLIPRDHNESGGMPANDIGKIYAVPVYVDMRKGFNIGIRWILYVARETANKPFAFRLTKQLLNIVDGHGDVIKRKEDLYRKALNNRAYLIYL